MAPLHRIGVLVERGAVELRQPVRIVGEMPRHPVQHHGEPGVVARIDEMQEIVGAAVAARRCIEAGRLIAPGSVERMLHHRQELDVGEAEVARVGRQFLRELAVTQPAIALLGAASPGTEVDLVDGDWSTQRIDAGREGMRLEPLHVEYDRGGRRARLGRERERIGFARQQRAGRPEDFELVLVSDPRAGNEDFPEPVAAHAHGVPPPVPKVEIADDADAPRVRREHRESDAVDAFERERVSTELLVGTQMLALAEQMQIEIGKDRGKPVGVLEFDGMLPEQRAQAIRPVHRLDPSGEQSGRMNARQRMLLAAALEHRHLPCVREIGPHDRHAVVEMRTEIDERIGVTALDQRDGLCGELAHGRSAAGGDGNRMREAAANGTRTQSGRFVSS